LKQIGYSIGLVMILVLMYMVKHLNYHHVYKNCHDLDMSGAM